MAVGRRAEAGLGGRYVARRCREWGGSAVSGESEFGAPLDSFSQMRRDLEASVLPLATSVDGRRFSLQASLYGLALQAGGYVVLSGDGVSRLGRVLTLDLDRELSTELTLSARAGDARDTVGQVQIRYARGDGIILEGDPAPYHDVPVRVATGPEVQGWLERNQRPGRETTAG